MKEKLRSFKEFFLENSVYYRKFWVFQFVISLLGVMITLPVFVFVNNNPQYAVFPYVIALIFTAGIFCFLIYDTMYQLGARDCVKVSGGRMTAQPFKGLKLVLTAYIPTFFIALLDVIFKLAGWGDGYVVTHLILNFVLHGQYSGFMYLIDNLAPLGDLIGFIPTILFGFLGYRIALADKTLRGIFGFKVKQYRE